MHCLPNPRTRFKVPLSGVAEGSLFLPSCVRTVPPFAFCYSFFSPVGIAELYTRPGSGSACRRRGRPRPIAVPRPSPRDPLISNFLLACRRASFSLDKSLQKILEQVCNRLTASRSHRVVTVCTARRRGVPFVRMRRRGLRSMSGHPAYAWGNPPTLRRSSFPQRALRPAGERRTHRSREGCPKHSEGSARLKRRLRSTRRRL